MIYIIPLLKTEMKKNLDNQYENDYNNLNDNFPNYYIGRKN